IDLIDMRTRRDGEFKWIAYARDHFSCFSWGCILTDKCAAKVAVFLFDIFTVFGLPIFLQSDNGHEFTADIINNLSKLWPNLKII
ncbi:27192_t:CDS:1, partial [Racocetra persica]